MRVVAGSGNAACRVSSSGSREVSASTHPRAEGTPGCRVFPGGSFPGRATGKAVRDPVLFACIFATGPLRQGVDLNVQR